MNRFDDLAPLDQVIALALVLQPFALRLPFPNLGRPVNFVIGIFLRENPVEQREQRHAGIFERRTTGFFGEPDDADRNQRRRGARVDRVVRVLKIGFLQPLAVILEQAGDGRGELVFSLDRLGENALARQHLQAGLAEARQRANLVGVEKLVRHRREEF